MYIMVKNSNMKGIYKLSEQEKERIYLAREEFKNGKTISNKVVQKEINTIHDFSS